jgi:hypothetical protein
VHQGVSKAQSEAQAHCIVNFKELGVYQRLASTMPCPAAKFLMGLEFSFETKDEICFAMVCAFPLQAIRVI